ncbi:MAG: M20/M25/M40 family metallo-hydrolase [Nitrospirae bacterium]|nr:MAG: M20/M25/M40 family metallo-hydrolase [Nitrospirota bacterium]
MVDTDRLLNTLFALLEVDSPSFNEDKIGLFIEGLLKETGIHVIRQDYGDSFNLVGKYKNPNSPSPPLILSAHMDTIEPTVGIKYNIKDEKLSTKGDTVLGADDKSGVAAIIEVLRVIREHNIQTGDIEVVFTSAEERGIVGAKNLDYSLIEGRYAVVLDVSGAAGTIVKRAPTHHTYTMEIHGMSAHAGIEPEKGLNAIRIASEIIGRIPDGRLDEDTTANIGRITGGTATNVVPETVLIEGEVRSQSVEKLTNTKDTIFKTGRSVTKKYPGASIEIKENEEYRGYSIEEKDPFLTFLKGEFSKKGIEPIIITTGGGSDANVFNQRGIKAINIATGMEKVHSKEEYLDLKEFFKVAEVLLNIVINFKDFAESTP